MKRMLTIVPALALATVVGVATTWADDYTPRGPGAGYGQMGQHGPMGEHGPMGWHRHGGQGRGMARLEAAIDQLDLTDEQRTQVRSIIDGARNDFRKTADEMRANRKALRSEMQKDAVDEKAVKALADKKGALVAQMTVLRASIHNQVSAVLTPEQREQLRTQIRPEGGRHFGMGAGPGRFQRGCNFPPTSS